MIMALVWVFIYRARQNFGLGIGLLAFIIYWMAFEFIHYHWELSWPFMNLGNWLGQTIRIIQWYEYTGVLGGTLWVLLVNMLLFLSIRYYTKNQKYKSITLFIISLLLIIVPIKISTFIYHGDFKNSDSKRYLIIQPNIDPYTEKYNMDLFTHQINQQITLAQKSGNAKIDCYIFPESSFPVDVNELGIDTCEFVKYIKSKLIFNKETCILGGFYSYKPAGEDTLFYNTAFLISNNSSVQLRHKSKLVIGVEKMPFQEYFGSLRKWNLDFGGNNTSIATDNEPTVFISDDKRLKMAPIICYESVYGEYVASFINKGANVISVITNDGWWGDTPGFKQHLMHSQLRAIENRRAVVRAANTGTSCFINEKGEVLKEIAPWRQDTLAGTLPTIINKTFYTKHGDFIGEIALYISAMLLLINIIYPFIDVNKPRIKNHERAIKY